MGEKGWSAENVFDLFGDGIVRHILVLASRRPVSADELADQLDASPPTIYRRVNTLVDYDLLDEEVRIGEDGNHYRTFETTLKRVTFEVDSGGYDIDIELRQSLVDQFEAFWDDLEGSSPDVDSDSAASLDPDAGSEGYDG